MTCKTCGQVMVVAGMRVICGCTFKAACGYCGKMIDKEVLRLHRGVCERCANELAYQKEYVFLKQMGRL